MDQLANQQFLTRNQASSNGANGPAPTPVFVNSNFSTSAPIVANIASLSACGINTYQPVLTNVPSFRTV